MFSRVKRSLIVITLVTFGLLIPSTAQAAAPLNVESAISWIGSKQQSNGSFEMAGIPGFETPDAVFAIAEAANANSSKWEVCVARNANLERQQGTTNPIRYLDDFVDSSGSSLSVAVAGQLALYVRAMGYDATKFDPDGDGAANLLQLVDAAKNSDGSYGPAGSFATTLWAVLAKVTSEESIDATTKTYILSTQQADGGFNFAGDSAGTGVDIDTTGRALQALAALGMTPTDAEIKNAVAFLANHQQGDGGFLGEFQTESNASSTALVLLGFKTLGIYTSTSTWRDNAVPSLVGTPYVDPQQLLATRQVADGHVTTEYDTSFFSTLGTTQSVQAAVNNFVPGVTEAKIDNNCPAVLGNTITNSGDAGRFRFAFANGTVLECHPSQTCTTASTLAYLTKPIVAAAVTSTGNGYWLFGGDGGVFTYGDAGYFGSAGSLQLNKPIVGAAPTPDNNGYTLFASDGGVFTYGNASFHGSAAGLSINNVVGGASTKTGGGYWLFGSDGGVFTYGDAAYLGSAADLHIHGRIVAGDVSSGGNGYALFASDGGVFTYGDQPFFGSAATLSLNRPMIKGFVDHLSGGYTMLAGDGGVFVYGNSNFVVSLAPNATNIRDLMIG